MATNYGVTDTGFVTKRYPEILTENRRNAVTLFQDLVAVGDVVDTSDSGILGRFISLMSPGQSDLWEVAQLVYSAFDANQATGITLDNLVALAGLVRKEASATTALELFTGNVGVTINASDTLRSATTNTSYNPTRTFTLSPTGASGIGIQITNVADNTTYNVTYNNSNTSSIVSYTSGTGATALSILEGIRQVIATDHASLKTSLIGNTLYIDRLDYSDIVNFSSSSNVGIVKARNLIYIRANVTGPITEEVGSITDILTPRLGWDSASNPYLPSQGERQETDEELRARFSISKAARASNIIEALYSALEALDNVEEVIIYENDTSVTNDKGVPGHSFMTLVLGGINADIAQVIWDNKPAGIGTYGTSSYEVLDSQGNPHTINFQRPEQLPIYISINLTKFGEYPSNGDALIKQALVDYFKNFGIGDDVIYSRLYTPLNSVPGHQVNSLTIGTSPAPSGMGNIPINYIQVASLSTSNIIITSA